MVTVVAAATLVVVMLNFADVAPAGTVTVAGTLADTSELLNVTAAPVDGAGPVRYTVLAEDGVPPARTVGERASDDSVTGFTVRVAGIVMPP